MKDYRHRNTSFDYLVHFESLLSLGLSSKAAIELLPKLFSQFSSVHSRVSQGLSKGKSMYDVLDSLLSFDSFRLAIHDDKIDIKQWLKKRLEHEKVYKKNIARLFKKLLYSVSLFLCSIIVLIFLIYLYIPKIHTLFYASSQKTPVWIHYLILIPTAVQAYLPILLFLICATAYLFKSRLFKYYDYIKYRLFYSQYLSRISMLFSILLSQGIPFKELVQSVTIHDSHPVSKAMRLCKNQINFFHDSQHALRCLFKDPYQQAVITQALHSNELDKGFAFLSQYLFEQQMKELDITTFIISCIAILLTSVTLIFGFYITMYPLTRILEGI